MQASKMFDISAHASPTLPERGSARRGRTQVQGRSTQLMPEVQTTTTLQSQQSTQALREAIKEMDGALSLVSHELKSPLTTVLGCLQLIGSHVERLASLPPTSPEAGKTFTKIHDLLALATRQIEIEDRLATDLLDASRVRTAQLALLPRLCDLGQLTMEAVAAQRIVFPRRKIHLDVPGQTIPVAADPNRITQVVANFLANALKYSPSDLPVTVRVVVRRTSAQVSVEDLGPGLAKGERKRVWERFYRVHDAPVQSAARAGLGLGLYIAREIIRRHGGRVGVTSKPAQGATFWFTLPLVHSAWQTAKDTLESKERYGRLSPVSEAFS